MNCCVCRKEITRSYGASYCYGNYCLKCAIENDFIDEAEQQTAILEKALELACKRVEERYTPSEIAEGYGCNPRYFIKKAKEMLQGGDDE